VWREREKSGENTVQIHKIPFCLQSHVLFPREEQQLDIGAYPFLLSWLNRAKSNVASLTRFTAISGKLSFESRANGV